MKPPPGGAPTGPERATSRSDAKPNLDFGVKATPDIKRFTIWYLYSGFSNIPGNIEVAALYLEKKLGLKVIILMIDIENGAEHNVLDEVVWNRLKGSLATDPPDAGLMAPSCSTFGCRRKDGSGPEPLREAFGPQLYGTRELLLKTKKR